MKYPLLSIGFAAGISVSSNVALAQEDDEHHTLDEIIVSATPLERTVEQLAQPTSVLSGDALVRSQSTSIGETLADQPGVSSTYFGPVASRPVIRGQFGERVRVLSNGLDALDASALSEDHAVSLDSILADRIEVVRGPATLLYGSGAAGGLVNIVDSRIHENPLERPFSGAVAIGSDSATGKQSVAGKFDVGNEQLALHVDAFSRDTDDIEIPGFAESPQLRALEEDEDHEDDDDHEEEEAFGVVENTSSSTSGNAIAFSWTGDAGFLGLSMSNYDSNYGVPGGHHHEEEEGGEEEEEEEFVSIDLDQRRYDLHGRYDFGALIESVRIRFAHNDYTHTEFEGDEIGTVFDVTGTDARIELKHQAFGRLEGAVGMQYSNIDFNAIGDEAFVPPSDTEQFSLFAFEEFGLSDRWTLQFSARAENQKITSPSLPSYDDTAFGISFGAIWALTDTMSLAGNLAVTERNPTSTELYADGPHIAVQRFERGSVTAGAGMLDKEQSTNIDLTLRTQVNRFEINITGFSNTIKDYLVLRPTAETEDGFQVFVYGQADVDMYGFEAEALMDIFENSNGHLHARFVTDYVFAEETTGAYLSRIPPLRYGFGLHYTLNAFETSIEAMHHDEQNKTGGELPTDGFTMVNAEASIRFGNDQVLAYLRGTNLGDEDARRSTSPLKDIVPLPGRSVHVGLRWDF